MKSSHRRTVVRLVALSLFGLTAVVANAQDIKERNIKFPIVNAIDHPQGLGAQKFADLVEKKSGGKMKVKVFANGTLGGEQQVASAMQGGTIEASMMAPAQLVGMIKEFVILDFPFAFASERAKPMRCSTAVRQEAAGQAAGERPDRARLHGAGYRSITNGKRPIKQARGHQRPEDPDDPESALRRHDERAGRERGADGVHRAVRRHGAEGGRRPGEPLRNGRSVEVLRSASTSATPGTSTIRK